MLNETWERAMNEWNVKAFAHLSEQFADVEAVREGRLDILSKRIHFWVDERRYLCASFRIYPNATVYGNKPAAEIELNIYEDNRWSSYFDGSIYPRYVEQAKLIQRGIHALVATLRQIDPSLPIHDYSLENIERVEQLSENKRRVHQELYDRYHAS